MPGRAAEEGRLIANCPIVQLRIKKIGKRVIKPEKKLKKVIIIGWYLKEFFLYRTI